MDVGGVLLFKGPKGRFRYERGSKKAIGGLQGQGRRWWRGSWRAAGAGASVVKGREAELQVQVLFAALLSGRWQHAPYRRLRCSSGDAIAWRCAPGHLAPAGGAFPPRAAPRAAAAGMIAGGSGITPMYQVAQEILRDPNDPTALSLIYANVAGEPPLSAPPSAASPGAGT